MTKTLIKGTEVETRTILCQVQLLNDREFAARQASSLLTNLFYTKRTELFVFNPNTGRAVCRKTLNTYDTKLQAHRDIPDYRRDAYTKKSVWDNRKPWNAHQVWCLQKVAKYMQTPSIYRHSAGFIRRLPMYSELDKYIADNANAFTYVQFIQEYFGWRPPSSKL